MEDFNRNMGLEDWVTMARRRVFEWAGHISRREDNRWGTIMLDWNPPRGTRFLEPGHGRTQSRPKARWHDKLVAYFDSFEDPVDWRFVAAVRKEWFHHVDKYLQFLNS